MPRNNYTARRLRRDRREALWLLQQPTDADTLTRADLEDLARSLVDRGLASRAILEPTRQTGRQHP